MKCHEKFVRFKSEEQGKELIKAEECKHTDVVIEAMCVENCKANDLDLRQPNLNLGHGKRFEFDFLGW